MTLFRFALLSAMALAAPTLAADWVVQTDKSHLGFSGVQTGAPFKGSFGKWTAEIGFDPAHPEAGHAKVTIDLASAHTGDTQRDAALAQSDWFDIKHFPWATFEASGFTPKGGDAYEAAGRLNIRGVAKDVALPFTLAVAGDSAMAKGHLTLVRTAFGVGQGPWTSGEWVALEVGVDFNLVAVKAGD
jgi:polyisoprenoid-binding protein YceI